ncbi:MAG: tRNA epoxyqueuosine(34) reductase QueG [bacterium]|nr:tRNA epoxyqueuosine(34) reductase QueG [bacterium]
MSTPTENAAAVKRAARECGFDACAIARADDVDPEDRLGAWLDAGYHADMAWIRDTHDVRQDVQAWLPGARSVVVLAADYYAPRPDVPANSGRVSRYAWGRDYHNALRKPVRRVARFIEDLKPVAKSKCSVDSGPVLEKFWAARAGLGWIGKNSLVLRTDMGSWFFLAVVATTVELAPDAPVADGCGGCRRCLDACPTGAIVAPGTVNAARCISYQTVENRGAVPDEVRHGMDRWVFGCDVCQDVCPWNGDRPATIRTDFHPRPSQANPDLEALMALDEETFRARFSGTPLMRRKVEGIHRSAAMAEENARNGPSRIPDR